MKKFWKKSVFLASLILVGTSSTALADTPEPRTNWPYYVWLDTAAPRVPSAGDLYPGVHRHILVPDCDNWYTRACTNGAGEIWMRSYVFNDWAMWRRAYHHEVAHNVQAQEMLDGHKKHFLDLMNFTESFEYRQETWAEQYAQCALNGPPMSGISAESHYAVCGWLERATWGVRYYN
jgi:hypothetical protein